MPAPVVLQPPADPIDIDPNVDYAYVIPTYGETSIRYDPVGDFNLSDDGSKTLTVKYIGPDLVQPKTQEIGVFCTNAHGEVLHKIKFRVGAAATIFKIPTSFPVAAFAGGKSIAFNTKTFPGKSINGKLPNGTKVKFEFVSGTEDPALTAAALYVFFTSADDTMFRVCTSATGSTPYITVASDGVYNLIIATTKDGSPLIFSAGIPKPLVLNQKIQLTYDDTASVIPTNLTGIKYLKEIVDQAHIKLSDTSGGAIINANADSFAADADVSLVVDLTQAPSTRSFPNITSDAFLELSPSDPPLDFDLAADITVNRWQVAGLPEGFSFNKDTKKITGSPITEFGFFVIVLLAEAAGTSKRYFLLNIIAAGSVPDLAPVDIDVDLALDLGTRRVYMLDGPAGRGDRIDVILGDAPMGILLKRFADPTKLETGAVIRFGLKPKNDFDSGTYLVYGSLGLVADKQALSIGENWSSPDLIALFENQRYLDFLGQFEWKLAGETEFTKSLPLAVRVWNNIFRDDTVPGAAPIVYPYYYYGWIERLTGGVGATDLDALPIAAYPPKTVIKVIIPGRGASEWRKEQDATSPATDVEAANGIIQPPDYNAVTMPWILHRVSGF